MHLVLQAHTSIVCLRAVVELIVRWCDAKVVELLFDVAEIRVIESMIDAARDGSVKVFLEGRRHSQHTTGVDVSVSCHTPVSPDDSHAPFYRRCPVKQVHILVDYEDEVWASAFSPTDTQFATGGRDGIIKILSATTFELLSTLMRHSEGIICLQWSPDDERLISGSHDGVVRIWDGEVSR